MASIEEDANINCGELLEETFESFLRQAARDLYKTEPITTDNGNSRYYVLRLPSYEIRISLANDKRVKQIVAIRLR